MATCSVVQIPPRLYHGWSYAYALSNAAGDEALAAAKRDAEFIGTTGAAEDRAVVCAIQRGLASGANDVFTFGQFERAIAHFHRALGI